MNRYDIKEINVLAVYISLFILLTAGTVLSSYLSYRSFEQQFHAQTEHQLSVIAKLKVNELSNWRKEQLNHAETLRHNITFAELAQAFFKNPQDVPAHTQIQAWLESYQVHGYDRVRLLDTQGKTILSVPTSAPPISSVVAQHIPEVLQSKKVVMVDFYYSDTDQRIDLAFLIPITNSQSGDQIIGLVSLIVNPQTYLYPYIIEWPSDSTTAETLLIRRDGNEALFLNPTRFAPNAALNLRFPLSNTNLPAVKAVLGQTEVVTGLDYRGEQVLADVRAVPDSPWFLVSKMDIAEVDAPLTARLWLTLLLAGTAILIAGASLMTVRRQQRLQFYRTQAEAAEALIVSEARYRRLFEAARDGILILDAETGVIVDANPFLIEMLGFPYEEFVGKELWELGFFKDVAANKENFLELQRKEYIRYEDLPLETSDGRNFYVEFVSNVYMVDDHKVIQCNIRDITERKLAADALNVSETRYHRLFEAARDGILILDAETGMILDVNSFLIELLGFSQNVFLGKALWELGFFKDIAANKANFLELQQQEYIKYENLPLETSDGRVIQVEFVSYVYLVDQHKFIQCNIRDITERKRADEKLKLVNDDLKQAQFVAHLGNWKWNLKTSTVEWSDEMYNIFGIDKGPDTGRLGSVIAKVIHPDDLHIVLPENAAKFAKNKPQEYRIIRPKDGEIRHIWAQAGESILDAQGNPLFLTGIAQDITERKLAKETLEKSEKQFRLLFEEMGSGVAVHEIICDESGTPADFRFLSVNTAFEKMTGLEASNILGKTVLEVIPETESSWIERYGKVALTGGPIQFEGFSEALGKYYEVRAYRPEHGKFVTIINDITERKQAEINLRESEANLSALIENTDGSNWTVDEQYRLIVGNEEFHRNTSAALKRRLEARESVLQPSFPLEVNAEWQRYYDRALQGKCFAIETQTHFRETLRHIEYRFSPIRVANDEIRGVTVYGRDITERKQAEDELRVALIKYKTLFDCFPQGITVSDEAGKILETNSAAVRLLGVPLEEHTRRGIGGADWKIVRSDGTPMPPEEFSSVRVLKEKRVIENVEMGIVKADNSITWISVNAAPLPVEGYGVVVTYGDITERKQAEEKLQHSEYNLAEAERIGHTGSWEYEVASDTANWSENMFNIFDVDPAMPRELVFKYFIENLVYPDDRAHILSVFEDALAGKRQYDLEYRVVKRDGSIRDIHTLAETIRDEDGKAVRMIGKVEDITERKQAEKELRFKNELLLMTSEMAKIGGWEFDALTQEGTWTDEVAYIHDLDPGQPTNVTLGSSFYLPDSRRKIELAIQQALESAQPYDLELKMISAKGNEKWVRTIGHPIVADGKVIKIQGIFQEITERKLAEDALRETNEYLENLINYANAPIIVWDPQFEITRFNHAFEILTGRSAADTLGKQLEILFPPALVQSSMQLIQNTQSDEHWEVVEISVQHVDGSIHAVLWNSATLFSSDGTTPIATIAQGQDITQRKQAEEKLRENILRLELAMQSANMAWWEMNISTGDITFSERKAKMLGYPPEQFKHYSDFMALVHPEDSDKAMNAMQRHIDGISAKYEVEYRISTKSEGYKWFYDLGSIVKRDLNGRPLNATGLAIDITERKRAEEKQINSELRYRRLFEAARDGILILDAKTGIVVDVNPFLVEMLGFPYEEFVGKELWELGFFKDIAANKENFLELQRKEYIRYEDLPLETIEGRKFHVDFIINVYEANHQKVIQCNIRDISERQRMEEELRKTMDDLAACRSNW